MEEGEKRSLEQKKNEMDDVHSETNVDTKENELERSTAGGDDFYDEEATKEGITIGRS